MSTSSHELRQRFIKYFERHGHTAVQSAPLVPKDDPTLMFVNAGMVQFKDVFIGKDRRPYTRATSSQKCVRAGGKHNDLENVGRTARHQTFFEMLGNFSFGDYFKAEACTFAWDFLTKEIGLDPKRLHVTVFGGENGLPADDEAYAIWRDIVGVPAKAISRKGMADNFWAMGDMGPCGPCTEIHYDRSDIQSAFGGDDPEGDKLIEVWNLVFMQYERKADGTLIPLPAPCVDTGMGLERLATVVNKVGSNYDTDLLKPFVDLTASLSGKTYNSSDAEDDVSLRVVADHARTTAFLIADGVLPGNEGRGYVLRRIMRRAIRHGARLGFDAPFFHLICDAVVGEFSNVYPELKEAQELMARVVLQEEETFRRTLSRGLQLFDDAARGLAKGDSLDGAVVFRLYETYGFPADLTQILADERGLHINWQTFEEAKKRHEEASAGALGLSGVADIYKSFAQRFGSTPFIGDRTYKTRAKIVALIKNDEAVSVLGPDESAWVILDQTPFYGESGGQIGDTGEMVSADQHLRVNDTKKISELICHQVKVLSGSSHVGDFVDCTVDGPRREAIRRHHSATHLLHAALRQVLGTHVTQKGSLVAEDRLRFDFSHFEPVTQLQLAQVEDLVNEWIRKNPSTQIEVIPFAQAKSGGAMALFGEKYPEEVRVVSMGTTSKELCGGTHVNKTCDIGYFRVTHEGPLSAGVRRLEAVAGRAALVWTREEESRRASEFQTRLDALSKELRDTKKQLEQFQRASQSSQAKDAVKKVTEINGIPCVAEVIGDVSDVNGLRTYADALLQQLNSGVVVVGAAFSADKCALVVSVSKDLTARVHAGQLAGQLAQVVGGKGGGRPDFAQAGGPDASKIGQAIDSLSDYMRTL